MEIGDEREGQRHRSQMRIEPCMRQWAHGLFEDACNRWLADPAQRQAAQGYAQLNGRQKIPEVLLQPADDAGSRLALRDELLDARLADADQRELRRHKEAVRQDQHHDGDAVKEEELRHVPPQSTGFIYGARASVNDLSPASM